MPYPKEKMAEFVVEKLDVTTLPSAIRPKREKGKKTFGDYGSLHGRLTRSKHCLPGAQVSIRIPEQEASGIYVCAANTGKNESNGLIQRAAAKAERVERTVEEQRIVEGVQRLPGDWRDR